MEHDGNSSSIKVGDTVTDTRYAVKDTRDGAETHIVWDVVAVEHRDDGKFDVKLERDDGGDMVTTTLKCHWEEVDQLDEEVSGC